MKRALPFVLLLVCVAVAQPPGLSLKRAVELALGEEGSVPLQLAREAVVQSRSQSAVAKAALLPNFEVSAGAQNLTRNLRALGLPSSSAGFPFPATAGPFNVLDMRGGASQAVLNLSALHRYRASKSDLLAAESDVEVTAEQTAERVAKAYLAALRGKARLEAEQAALDLANVTLRAAQHNLDEGTVTALDVSRAQLRVASVRQKVLEAATEARTRLLALRRAIGLRMDFPLELSENLAALPPPVDANLAWNHIASQRPEWKTQQFREQSLAKAVRSARAESLPSVHAFADYGGIGTSVPSTLATHSAGVSVRFPLFDSGRRRANTEASASRLRQERSRTQDLRDEIQFQLEVAAGQVRSTQEAVSLAEAALDHARRVLEQSQRRYRNGAAEHLTVAEAENDVAQTRASHIEALYACHVAWVDFQRAAGVLRKELRER